MVLSSLLSQFSWHTRDVGALTLSWKLGCCMSPLRGGGTSVPRGLPAEPSLSWPEGQSVRMGFAERVHEQTICLFAQVKSWFLVFSWKACRPAFNRDKDSFLLGLRWQEPWHAWFFAHSKCSEMLFSPSELSDLASSHPCKPVWIHSIMCASFCLCVAWE